ncbi:MAG: hypothetical protein IPH18_10545 [Chitinophagaceae bacterium]|nr:hypothetical protein [Chitinophagaceae bacterium]
MNRPQWITIGAGVALVAALFIFGKIIPPKSPQKAVEQHSPDDGHNHEKSSITIDTLLTFYKRSMPADLVRRAGILEEIARKTAEKTEKLHNFHQIARFWADTGRAF